MLHSTRGGSRETEEKEFTVVASGPRLGVVYRHQTNTGRKLPQRLSKITCIHGHSNPFRDGRHLPVVINTLFSLICRVSALSQIAPLTIQPAHQDVLDLEIVIDAVFRTLSP